MAVYNGGNNGTAGQKIAEVNESDLGAYMLVNWDDDNQNDKPDMYEPQAANDDDLAKIELSILPDELTQGQIRLVGVDARLKVWDSQSKQNVITEFSWDIDELPDELWLEAMTASKQERDISLALEYRIDDAIIAADNTKATAVMINLGNAVYRDNEVGWGVEPERGHSAIVYKYIGDCTKESLNDSNNFKIIEMRGPTNNKTLSTITECGILFYGCYTNVSSVTYSVRLSIINSAFALSSRNIEYEALNAIFPHNWDGDINTITDLRCDGLVEVCYELNGIPVWAMKRNFNGISYNFDISDQTDILSYNTTLGSWISGANIKIDNLEEHNDFDVGYEIDWNDTFQPATQCGHVTPVNAITTFTKQNLCQPVGNTGGN